MSAANEKRTGNCIVSAEAIVPKNYVVKKLYNAVVQCSDDSVYLLVGPGFYLSQWGASSPGARSESCVFVTEKIEQIEQYRFVRDR